MRIKPSKLRPKLPTIQGRLEARLSRKGIDQNVWRWVKEAAGNDLVDLKRMVDQQVRLDMPLAYCIGDQPFGPLTVLCRPPILIPRPETEEWAFKLAKQLNKVDGKRPLKVLEVGVGTGCVSLLLSALCRPNSINITGVDINLEAIDLATANQRHNNHLMANSVRFLQASLFDLQLPNILEGKFDLLVSNPPYITPTEYERLPRSVKDWESKQALIGSDNGLEFYRQIYKVMPALLDTRSSSITPVLVVEIGANQGQAVAEIFRSGSDMVELETDSFGRDRVIKVYRL